MPKKYRKLILVCIFFSIIFFSCFQLTGCTNYDKKIDVNYFFKTDPEKAVIDFFQALNSHDLIYIYNNFLLQKDRNNISSEKFVNDFSFLLSSMESISIKKTVYLGYENNMSKVVAEFDIKYKNGQSLSYKKYIYLLQENNKWKIVFEKTFI
jgi:hypothetical protein